MKTGFLPGYYFASSAAPIARQACECGAYEFSHAIGAGRCANIWRNDAQQSKAIARAGVAAEPAAVATVEPNAA
jgi:hypothetical protein